MNIIFIKFSRLTKSCLFSSTTFWHELHWHLPSHPGGVLGIYSCPPPHFDTSCTDTSLFIQAVLLAFSPIIQFGRIYFISYLMIFVRSKNCLKQKLTKMWKANEKKTRGCLFAFKSTMVISKLHYFLGQKSADTRSWGAYWNHLGAMKKPFKNKMTILKICSSIQLVPLMNVDARGKRWDRQDWLSCLPANNIHLYDSSCKLY